LNSRFRGIGLTKLETAIYECDSNILKAERLEAMVALHVSRENAPAPITN